MRDIAGCSAEEGDVVEERSKLVASRGRLLRRIDARENEVRDAYTRRCADRVAARRIIYPIWVCKRFRGTEAAAFACAHSMIASEPSTNLPSSSSSVGTL
jgi:hypothetical protein